MRADVETIVGLLSEQILTSSEEARIVAKVRLYADMDADQAAGGPALTPRLDKFLLLLKTRVFSRRTARSGWIEQWMNAYDTCWHELEDDNRTEFAALVGRSAKHGSAGPREEQDESLYSVIGKHEAMGVWGMLKGLGLTLSGVADVAIWAAWKQTGEPLGLILERFGVKDASKAPALTPYLSKNYDEVAKLMGDAMGVDPSKDQSLLGQSSYEIGEFGGKIVGALTMAGAGGGTAGEAVMGGTKVLTVLGALKGIEDSGAVIAARVAALRKRKPPPGLGELLTDETLLLEAASMLANALGAAAGAGDAAPALAKAFKSFGLVADAAQLAPTVAKAWKDYNDPELAKDPEQRDAALRDAAASILGTILSTAGSKHQEAVEARAEKSMADFDAAFQERYNAPSGSGADGGGAGGGGGGDHDPFDRSGPSDLGGGEVLEPHPGGHQNEPEFIPADADHPEAGTGNRDELFDTSGKPVGPATEYLPYREPSARQLRDTSLSGGYSARPRGRPTDHDIDASRGRGRYVRNAYTRDRRQHHVLPVEHVGYFAERGFLIDNFCVSLSNADHEALHRMGWNERWGDWIAEHPDATPAQVMDFAGNLRREAHIDQQPYEPWEGTPTPGQPVPEPH